MCGRGCDLLLPPFRERQVDVPELVQRFFVRSRAKHSRPQLVLPACIVHCCSRYDWPGNVRQLENAVERLALPAKGEEITAEELPDFLKPEAM